METKQGHAGVSIASPESRLFRNSSDHRVNSPAREFNSYTWSIYRPSQNDDYTYPMKILDNSYIVDKEVNVFCSVLSIWPFDPGEGESITIRLIEGNGPVFLTGEHVVGKIYVYSILVLTTLSPLFWLHWLHGMYFNRVPCTCSLYFMMWSYILFNIHAKEKHRLFFIIQPFFEEENVEMTQRTMRKRVIFSTIERNWGGNWWLA